MTKDDFEQHINKQEHRQAEWHDMTEKLNHFTSNDSFSSLAKSTHGPSSKVANFIASIGSLQNLPPAFATVPGNNGMSLQAEHESSSNMSAHRSTNGSASNMSTVRCENEPLATMSAQSKDLNGLGSNGSIQSNDSSHRSNISMPTENKSRTEASNDKNETAHTNTSVHINGTINARRFVVRVLLIPWAATKAFILRHFDGVNILNGADGIHFIVDKELDKPNNAYIELESEDDFLRIKEINPNRRWFRGKGIAN